MIVSVPETRVCSLCEQELPLTGEYFSETNSGSHFFAYCKKDERAWCRFRNAYVGGNHADRKKIGAYFQSLPKNGKSPYVSGNWYGKILLKKCRVKYGVQNTGDVHKLLREWSAGNTTYTFAKVMSSKVSSVLSSKDNGSPSYRTLVNGVNLGKFLAGDKLIIQHGTDVAWAVLISDQPAPNASKVSICVENGSIHTAPSPAANSLGWKTRTGRYCNFDGWTQWIVERTGRSLTETFAMSSAIADCSTNDKIGQLQSELDETSAEVIRLTDLLKSANKEAEKHRRGKADLRGELTEVLEQMEAVKAKFDSHLCPTLDSSHDFMSKIAASLRDLASEIDNQVVVRDITRISDPSKEDVPVDQFDKRSSPQYREKGSPKTYGLPCPTCNLETSVATGECEKCNDQ